MVGKSLQYRQTNSMIMTCGKMERNEERKNKRMNKKSQQERKNVKEVREMERERDGKRYADSKTHKRKNQQAESK